MSLGPGVLRRLRDVAVQAAREAGELVEDWARAGFAVERKEAGSSLASQVVTAVDRRAEAHILQVLGPSRREWGLGALAEESGDDGSRFEKEAFWCIDPLDGTLPFVEGVPGYAVSIALVSRTGEALLGVVCDPRNGVLYEAVAGQGCRIDGRRYRLPPASEPAPPLSVFSDRSSTSQPGHRRAIAALNAEPGWGPVTDSLGFGAALNACAALRSGSGCYFKLPKETPGGGSVWDFAATACMMEEAGGVVSDLCGEPLSLNPEESLFMHRKGVLYATDQRIASCIRKTDTKI